MIQLRHVDLVSPLKKFSHAASVMVELVAGIVLAGWVLDVDSWKGAWPGFSPMKANTALAFLLSAISLWTLGGKSTGLRRAGQACALMTALIGAITLTENGLGLGPGIGQCLFLAGAVPVIGPHPARVSQRSAFSHVLTRLALVACQPHRGLQ